MSRTFSNILLAKVFYVLLLVFTAKCSAISWNNKVKSRNFNILNYKFNLKKKIIVRFRDI